MNEQTATERILVPYRLPDGAIVQVDDSAAKGARCITYTMKGGVVVRAFRVLPPLELVQRIEKGGFECFGGPLNLNLDWQDLRQWIEDRIASDQAQKEIGK